MTDNALNELPPRLARWWSIREQAAPKINEAIAKTIGNHIAAMIRDGVPSTGIVAHVEERLAWRDAALDEAADFVLGAQDGADLADEVERQIG